MNSIILNRVSPKTVFHECNDLSLLLNLKTPTLGCTYIELYNPCFIRVSYKVISFDLNLNFLNLKFVAIHLIYFDEAYKYHYFITSYDTTRGQSRILLCSQFNSKQL